MYQFEVVHSFIQTNLVIPFEADIDWTTAASGCSFGMVIEIPIAKARLVAQVATKTEKNQFSAPVFFLVNSKNNPVCVAQLTIRVNCIKNTGKSLWEVPEVIRKSRVCGSPLLFQSQLS